MSDWKDNIPLLEGLDLLRAAEKPQGTGLINAENPNTHEPLTTGHLDVGDGTVLAKRMLSFNSDAQSPDWDVASIDNVTRWTLFPHRDIARIVFEFYEATGFGAVVALDYPGDREALWAIAQTGWLAFTRKLGKGKVDVLMVELSTHGDLERFLTGLDQKQGYETPTNNMLEVGLSIMKGMPEVEDRQEFIDMFRKSPALALGWSMMEKERENSVEQDILSILHIKAPVWSGAKGFSEAYELCKFRARIAKLAGGIKNTDSLTQHHCMTGGMLYRSRVIVMDSAQIVALHGQVPPPELLDFAAESHLPFEHTFLDFGGDGHMPTTETVLALHDKAHVLGALMYEWWDGQVLVITPFYSYTSNQQHGAAHGPVSLGSMLLNKSDDPTLPFSHMGNGYRFEFSQKGIISLGHTDVLDDSPYMYDLYRNIVQAGSLMAIECLHFIEAGNVRLVERTLERRDRKRAEKRGWNIPMTVRVERPNRRISNGSYIPTGNHVEFSHQFDVSGHYKHYTKGSNVACIVCKGNIDEDVPCSRCHNTGLDPEKISKCSRRDDKTGQLTCPDGCRRIWTGDFIKGDPTKPYVPKARRVISHPQEEL